MIVGITGGIGSGKSTACKLFQSLGVSFISADQIAHQLLETDPIIFKAIVERFGSDILDKQHKLNRAKIQQIIFNSQDDKQWLEQLLHPIIKQKIASETKNFSTPYCIVEIPLLIEAQMQDSVDRVLTIDCTENLQVERAMRRDNSSRQTVQSIMANQITRKTRLSNSDDIIDNSGDLETLKKLVIHQHNYYLSLTPHDKH